MPEVAQDPYAQIAQPIQAAGDPYAAIAKPVPNHTPVAAQPSLGKVLTQPTEKTDKEYLGYTGPAGVAGATIHGLNDVARGTVGAVKGMYDTIRHPIDTAKSMAELPKMAAQVPAAMHDINESPDPTGSYLNAAQDTVSQGAGQALTALGTMGAGRLVKPAIRLGARSLEAGINQKLVPIRPILNLGERADEAAKIKLKVPGRDVGLPKPISEGAQLPEKPPTEVLQGNALMRGARRIPDPAKGLGEIPVNPGGAGQMAESVATPEPGITNKAASQSLSKTLPESLGNEPIKIKPGVKIRDQFKTAEPKESSVVKSFDYNPETKELSVKTPNGNTYVHAEVTPEEAEGMKTAESKGEYWNNQIRANHRMVNKIMPSGAKLNSVPTNFRGVSPESGPEDVMPNRGAQLKGTKGAITSPESQDLTSEWSKAVQDALTKKGKTMGPPQ